MRINYVNYLRYNCNVANQISHYMQQKVFFVFL